MANYWQPQEISGLQAFQIFLNLLRPVGDNHEIWIKLGHNNFYVGDFDRTGHFEISSTKLLDRADSRSRVKVETYPDAYAFLDNWCKNNDGGAFYLSNPAIGAPLKECISVSDDLAVELDDGTPTEQLEAIKRLYAVSGLKPTFVLSSGGKSYHVHWKLIHHYPIELIVLWRKLLAICLLSDPAVVNPHQPMRLPGFYRREKGKNQTLEIYSNYRYNPDQIEAGLRQFFRSQGWNYPEVLSDIRWRECRRVIKWTNKLKSDVYDRLLSEGHSLPAVVGERWNKHQNVKTIILETAIAPSVKRAELKRILAKTEDELAGRFSLTANTQQPERTTHPPSNNNSRSQKSKNSVPYHNGSNGWVDFLQKGLLPRFNSLEQAFDLENHNFVRVNSNRLDGDPGYRSTSGSKSLTVSWKNGQPYFYDWSLGEGGDLVKYYWWCEGGSGYPRGKDYIYIVKKIADRQGVPIPEHLSDRKNRKVIGEVQSDLSRYNPVKIDVRYLPKTLLPPATAQLIGLRSAKGTGKTTLLSKILEKNSGIGKKTLVLTHRIALARALAIVFCLEHIEEIKTSMLRGLLGFSMCIDSLHPNSKARFNPSEWEGADIVIDEAKQVFWHLLNSNTCQKNRVKILKTLEELFKLVIFTGGRIILADADLDSKNLEYVRRIIGDNIETWILENTHIPNLGKRKIYNYESEAELIFALTRSIILGEKILLHTGSQKPKSKHGSYNLELLIKNNLPNLKTLRIDSDTERDPSHPAFNCTNNINAILPQFDVVIASPSVETGISIETGQFDSVWSIASGTQTVDSVCQTLERDRSDVPRHIFAKKVGLSKVGNGSTDVRELLTSEDKKTRTNIASLQQAGISDDFTPWGTNHLQTWAEMGCEVNAGMKKYRESILNKLAAEGYEILNPKKELKPDTKEQYKEVKEAIAANRDFNYEHHCKSVEKKETPDLDRLEELKQKPNKTQSERLEERKGQLKQLYGIEPDADLVAKDDAGWYSQLRLHYYLTVGREFLEGRDRQKLADLAEDTGKAFAPDVNKKLLSATVYALEKLNIKQFWEEGKKFSSSGLASWFELIKHPETVKDINTYLGITINPEKESAIAVAQKMLGLLGLSMPRKGRLGSRSNREYVYNAANQNPDNRARIFERWKNRDSDKLSAPPPIILKNQGGMDTACNSVPASDTSIGVHPLPIINISHENDGHGDAGQENFADANSSKNESTILKNQEGVDTACNSVPASDTSIGVHPLPIINISHENDGHETPDGAKNDRDNLEDSRKCSPDDPEEIQILADFLALCDGPENLADIKALESATRDRLNRAAKLLPIAQRRKLKEWAIELNNQQQQQQQQEEATAAASSAESEPESEPEPIEYDPPEIYTRNDFIYLGDNIKRICRGETDLLEFLEQWSSEVFKRVWEVMAEFESQQKIDEMRNFLANNLQERADFLLARST